MVHRAPQWRSVLVRLVGMMSATRGWAPCRVLATCGGRVAWSLPCPTREPEVSCWGIRAQRPLPTPYPRSPRVSWVELLPPVSTQPLGLTSLIGIAEARPAATEYLVVIGDDLDGMAFNIEPGHQGIGVRAQPEVARRTAQSARLGEVVVRHGHRPGDRRADTPAHGAGELVDRHALDAHHNRWNLLASRRERNEPVDRDERYRPCESQQARPPEWGAASLGPSAYLAVCGPRRRPGLSLRRQAPRGDTRPRSRSVGAVGGTPGPRPRLTHVTLSRNPAWGRACACSTRRRCRWQPADCGRAPGP
jgi:hypothetical protein